MRRQERIRGQEMMIQVSSSKVGKGAGGTGEVENEEKTGQRLQGMKDESLGKETPER